MVKRVFFLLNAASAMAIVVLISTVYLELFIIRLNKELGRAVT